MRNRALVIGVLASVLTLFGTVDAVRALSQVLPGDANFDGRVDFRDLTVVMTNYGKTGMTWSQGDFTGSGTVGIDDENIVLTNYDQSIDGVGLLPFPPATNSGGIVLGMTRNTTADPTYDILNLSIAALTGPAAGSGIVGMEGTWSASGGFFGMYTGSTDSWPNYTETGYGGGYTPQSCVNFNCAISGFTGWARTSAGGNFSSFSGSWCDLNQQVTSLGPGDTLATLWVTKGAQVTFTGAVGFTYGGGTVESVSVPEPGTLLLVTISAFSLLVFRRRRRG